MVGDCVLELLYELANSKIDITAYAVAGVIAGFGFSCILSMLGKSIYTIFNSLERSSY